jgi:lipoyl synthase
MSTGLAAAARGATASEPAQVLAALGEIEAFEDLDFDPHRVARLWRAGRALIGRPLEAATPSFRAYATDELAGCRRGRFPAFSITGGACALDCDHCQAKILEPMIPATRPEMLEREVRTRAAAGNLAGFLLSGGSNRRNEVPFERFLPTIARLKADLPHLRIAAHTGLVDRRRAERLAAAGVEIAMLDVIGAEATIREVYHLDRPVGDFEAALEALVATPLRVVPHVVIGLHYGRVLGEFQALEIIARHRVDACILVVVMPAFTRPGRFRGSPRASSCRRVAFCSAARVHPARRVASSTPMRSSQGSTASRSQPKASLLWRRRSAARLPRPMPAARSVPAGAERSRRARGRARTRR